MGEMTKRRKVTHLFLHEEGGKKTAVTCRRKPQKSTREAGEKYGEREPKEEVTNCSMGEFNKC